MKYGDTILAVGNYGATYVVVLRVFKSKRIELSICGKAAQRRLVCPAPRSDDSRAYYVEALSE
jgi:hypothetical protein